MRFFFSSLVFCVHIQNTGVTFIFFCDLLLSMDNQLATDIAEIIVNILINEVQDNNKQEILENMINLMTEALYQAPVQES